MMLLNTFEKLDLEASDMGTTSEDPKWSGRFVARIRAPDRESSIRVVDILQAFANSMRKSDVLATYF